jgi:hypothetical protein
MATVIHLVSGANIVVTETAGEVEDAFNSSNAVTTLTRETEDDVYVRSEHVTHWHAQHQRDPGGTVTGPAREDRPSAKPRFGRSLPKAP